MRVRRRRDMTEYLDQGRHRRRGPEEMKMVRDCAGAVANAAEGADDGRPSDAAAERRRRLRRQRADLTVGTARRPRCRRVKQADAGAVAPNGGGRKTLSAVAAAPPREGAAASAGDTRALGGA